MPVEQSRAVSPSGQSVTSHPKDVLYDGAYDPLTRAWFDALAISPERGQLLAEASAYGLLDTLIRFNELCYELVDVSLAGLYEQRDEIVAIVSRHRAHVMWQGHMAPGLDAGADEISVSLSEKMKRNISLGVIEALICLESAYHFCRDTLKLHGDSLSGALMRSRQLYASLAVLHDEQERVRLLALTGIDSLVYPAVDYQDVIDGTVRIPADKFVVAGTADAPRVKFVTTPVHDVALDSPVRRCPAHRFRSSENADLTLNDVLWNLLIDIYQRAGRFA